MIIRMGRVLSTVVVIVVGLFVLTDLFISTWSGDVFGLKPVISGIASFLLSWTAIVTAFALLLGFVNVISVHWGRIHTRKPGAIYSVALLLSLFATLAFGSGGPTSTAGQFIFDFVLQPLEATLFALLALFMATAAFRVFRIQSLESFFFVFFALVVLLGQVPLGIYLWSEFPIIKDWILDVPVLAGVRGILLGVALGVVATGLRVLSGADRPYID